MRNKYISTQMPVDQQKIRWDTQLVDRPLPRQFRRPEHVQRINFGFRCDANTPRRGGLGNNRKERLPFCGTHFFGIIKIPQRKPAGDNHRRPDNRTGQRPAAGLIQSGDPSIPAGPCLLFKIARGAKRSQPYGVSGQRHKTSNYSAGSPAEASALAVTAAGSFFEAFVLLVARKKSRSATLACFPFLSRK